MRIKIVLAMLLAGVAGLAGILILNRLVAPVQPAATPVALEPAAPPAAPPVQTANQRAALTPKKTVVPDETVDTNALAEAHEAAVQAQIDKLQELQANDDAQSLRAILDELTNPEKEVREAAIEATIQFGSRDAIPVLKDLASRFGDEEDRKEMLDAAEFLALPTMTEAQAANSGAGIIQPQVPSPAPEPP